MQTRLRIQSIFGAKPVPHVVGGQLRLLRTRAKKADADLAPDDGDEEPPVKKKRGRQAKIVPPKEEEPVVSSLDPAMLEEFKALAAVEEQERVVNYDPEADPRRNNFHRSLLNAAHHGDHEAAEKYFFMMAEAGLEPGPRAFHVLLTTYVKAKLEDEALAVAMRAVEEGLRLPAESYVVLIYAFCNLKSGPDMNTVLSLMDTMMSQEGWEVARGGWVMACTELFRKKYLEQAVNLVVVGYDEGYVGDEAVCFYLIDTLCKYGFKDRAMSELERMSRAGLMPGPEHFDPIILAESSSGDPELAMALLEDYSSRVGWMPVTVATFNAILEGRVSRLEPGYGGPEAVAQVMQYFDWLKNRMSKVINALPDRMSYKWLCKTFISLGEIDMALEMFDEMILRNGTVRTLGKKGLSDLLIAFAENGRPGDLVHMLKLLVREQIRIPDSASRYVSEDGRTLLTRWMDDEHFEAMALNREQELIDRDKPATREVDGVTLDGGNAVVDENGVWYAPAKMKLAELEIECREAGMDVEDKSRRELVQFVKDRREALSPLLHEAQAALKHRIKEEKDDDQDERGVFQVLAYDEGEFGDVGGDGTITVYANVDPDAAEEDALNKDRERKSKASQKMGYDSAYDADDIGQILSSGATDEGVRTILSDIDKIENDGLDDHGSLEKEDDRDLSDPSSKFSATIQDRDRKKEINASAGVSVAIDIFRASLILRCPLSVADFQVLVKAAVAECSKEAADMLSMHLYKLLPQYNTPPEGFEPRNKQEPVHECLIRSGTEEEVSSMYGALALMCIDVGRVATADLIMGRAEHRKVPLDPFLYEAMEDLLDGRSRSRCNLQELAPDEEDQLDMLVRRHHDKKMVELKWEEANDEEPEPLSRTVLKILTSIDIVDQIEEGDVVFEDGEWEEAAEFEEGEEADTAVAAAELGEGEEEETEGEGEAVTAAGASGEVEEEGGEGEMEIDPYLGYDKAAVAKLAEYIEAGERPSFVDVMSHVMPAETMESLLEALEEIEVHDEKDVHEGKVAAQRLVDQYNLYMWQIDHVVAENPDAWAGEGEEENVDEEEMEEAEELGEGEGEQGEGEEEEWVQPDEAELLEQIEAQLREIYLASNASPY